MIGIPISLYLHMCAMQHALYDISMEDIHVYMYLVHVCVGINWYLLCVQYHTPCLYALIVFVPTAAS